MTGTASRTATGAVRLLEALEQLGVELVFGLESVSVEGFGADFERALSDSMAAGEPRVIVVRASLKPLPITSPRSYRKA
jgi:acetolactate synthase-1/2/3 large subunit